MLGVGRRLVQRLHGGRVLQCGRRMAQQRHGAGGQPGARQARGRQAGQGGVAVGGVHDQGARCVGAAAQRVGRFLQRHAHGTQQGGHARGRLRVVERHVAGQQQVAAVHLRGQAGVVDEPDAVGAQQLAKLLQRSAQVGRVHVFPQQHLKAPGAQRGGHGLAVAARRLQHHARAGAADAHHQRQPLPHCSRCSALCRRRSRSRCHGSGSARLRPQREATPQQQRQQGHAGAQAR